MTTHRARLVMVLCFTWFSMACSRDKKPLPSDSTAAAAPVIPLPAPSVNTGWDSTEAGPVMLLSVSESETRAVVVLPYMTDSTLTKVSSLQLDGLNQFPVELFGAMGSAGLSILSVDTRNPAVEGCISWPVGVLLSAPRRSWRIGFRRGVATSLPLDSLETATTADSIFITTELARLASAVTEGADPAFEGLPFFVRKAYRFSLGSASVLVGDVIRKINEEANPREEHLLLIAERASRGNGRYSAVFHTRASGAEEAVRTNEILGAVRFVRTMRPAVAVTFGYEDGARAALIEKTADRSWKIVWRSAYTGC